MTTKSHPSILISGGGTGGHIFPALSIANALRRRDPMTRILFVGALGRMEMERVPAAGYEIVGLPVAGFDRRRPWRNIKVLWKLWRSMRMARRTLSEFAPDAVVGVGGYASGPVLKEAQKRGIPTLIQEQNSYAGVTNKLLAKKADAICVAYNGMERFFPAMAIVMTGNPVRSQLLEVTASQAEAKKELGFDPSRPLVMVTGGSLGARTVNESIAPGLKDLTDAGASVLWQTGKLYAEECAARARRNQPCAGHAVHSAHGTGLPRRRHSGGSLGRKHNIGTAAARQAGHTRALAQRGRGSSAQKRPGPR